MTYSEDQTLPLDKLSLSRYIPVFEKNRIDIHKLLNMTRVADYATIGIEFKDCQQLSLFIKSMNENKLTVENEWKSSRQEREDSLYSQPSLMDSSSRTSTLSLSSLSFLTPTVNTRPMIHCLEELLHESNLTFNSTDNEVEKRQTLIHAIDIFSRCIDINASPTSTPDGFTTGVTPEKNSKRSIRLSTLSMFSSKTMLSLQEEKTVKDYENEEIEAMLKNNIHPPSYNPLNPSSSTTELLPNSEGEVPHEAPEAIVPRPRKQIVTTTERLFSMPAYLHRPTSVPSSPCNSFFSPLPGYLESTIKHWQSLKTLTHPYEDEGREELPGYSCTVQKMGYVNIKCEKRCPTIKSRLRPWRKLYVELWGTVLRIYRTDPTTSEMNLSISNLFSSRKEVSSEPLMTMSLAGAVASRAFNYTRRPNVLRVTIPEGPQFLFRLQTLPGMVSWIENLQAAINISLDIECRPMPKFVTLGVRGSDEPLLTARTIMIERAREARRNLQEEVLL
ncbi:hypothetical protein BDF14DRAFT_1880882 [Spinellus fusiger]|nr:hypothetical protein BDF14DRAFT_1880882 [Spinellus fusiger]